MSLALWLKLKNPTPGHDQRHETLVKLLVEGKLARNEKRRAVRNVLSCPQCLAECNQHRQLWRLLTSQDYLDRWEDCLRERNPERYKMYGQVVAELQTTENATHAPSRPNWPTTEPLAVPWKRVAWVLILLLGVLIPLALYEVITLRKDMRGKEAYYKNLLAEMQRNHQNALPERAALDRQLSELSNQNRKQALEIQKLQRDLEDHTRPRADAVLTALLPLAFQPNKIHPVPVTENTLFLNLQVDVSGIKDYEAYSLTIADGLGNVVWQDDRVTKNNQGLFSLFIARHFFRPSDYILKIYAFGHKPERLVAQRRFRIIDRT